MENHKMLSIIVKAYNNTYDIDEEDMQLAGIKDKEEVISKLTTKLILDVDFHTGRTLRDEYDNRDMAVYEAIWAATKFRPDDFSYKILEVL